MSRQVELAVQRVHSNVISLDERIVRIRAAPRTGVRLTRTLAAEAPAVGVIGASCSEQADVCPLAAAAAPSSGAIDDLVLFFFVSRDEQYVRLRAQFAGRTHELGARVHNYLLLELARRRLTDLADGFTDSECGWIDQEEWIHDPTMAPPSINTSVLRIRRQFAALGIPNAGALIERRRTTRQLRIGARRLTIRPV